MKKSKLTAGLVTGLLSVVALAGCDGASYSPEGYILTYKDASGETVHYTADELFGAYYNDSSTLSSVFDKTYQLIVRNYFQVEAAGIEKYPDIKRKAQNEVDGVKKKAAENADTNGTNYDDEFDSLLKNYSCENEEELLEHFIYERELDEFEDYQWEARFFVNEATDISSGRPYVPYGKSRVELMRKNEQGNFVNRKVRLLYGLAFANQKARKRQRLLAQNLVTPIVPFHVSNAITTEGFEWIFER